MTDKPEMIWECDVCGGRANAQFIGYYEGEKCSFWICGKVCTGHYRLVPRCKDANRAWAAEKVMDELVRTALEKSTLEIRRPRHWGGNIGGLDSIAEAHSLRGILIDRFSYYIKLLSPPSPKGHWVKRRIRRCGGDVEEVEVWEDDDC